jgi:putative DNA-invertase from lambdoid prophage Rac
LRVPVPRPLHASYGRRERVRSLGTSDSSVATRLALPILAQWQSEFAAAPAAAENAAQPAARSLIVPTELDMMSGGTACAFDNIRRVSTGDQSIEAQRQALGGGFDKEFAEKGVSGATHAASRAGFSALLAYVREGDTVYVYALDRLGRDALDVQATVRKLLEMGVTLDVRGLGPIGRGVGELIVAVLAQIADMKRQRVKERCNSGREAAKVALKATGRTHRGKASLGRPKAADAAAVAAWRREHGASIPATMAQFGISRATVARYCAGA